ncbi:hypothetical protein GCM10023194_62560 [Planotetraspora phitsanulokensis]|uniref:Peptidoglycan recognition protein family domain-containing protein n=2 Tax=Planotetraspora phitsanulokensis TaxID=575192 RepID=A0A8J3U2S9_9ACTN|nr:hypothetical protein Pph01_25260 [Planotetraspora phitsanulokensis]
MIVALSTIAPVAAAAVAFVVVSGPSSTASPATQPPAPGQVNTLALRDLPSGESGGSGKRSVQGLPAAATKPFSLLGVSWDNAHEAIDGAVEVRTRAAASGTWSSWRPVEAESDDLPDAGSRTDRQARGATAPLWVGPSNGVEVRVTGKSHTLPRGLRLELVDPGNGKRKTGVRAAGAQLGDVTLAGAVSTTEPDAPADPASEPSPSTVDTPPPAEPATTPTPATQPATTPAATPTPTPPAPPSPSASPKTTPTPTPKVTAKTLAATPASTAPRPAIKTRASWGADESLVTDPPEYAPTVKEVFVHHTDGVNTYSCADSPAIIRGIMLYHVKTNGWNDVGYNFLVDKCGTIFEGRAGGIDRPVIGAHTLGFNTSSSGIALLGSFNEASDPAPSTAALEAISKLAAWKLGLAGGNPTGKVTLTITADNGKFKPGSYSFNTISGHRDGYATACPGTKLYAALPTIRTTAKQWTTPVTSLALSTITGATKVGSTYYTKGTVSLGWTARKAALLRYEVVVDGKVVSTPYTTASSASVTLATGSHKVQLRAVNINGTTATSPTYTVVTDKTAPTFSPQVSLGIRSGTVATTGVMPVSLRWKATDNTLLRSLKVASPSKVTLSTTATSWAYTSKNQAWNTWSVTAADAAGNSKTSSVTQSAALQYESSAKRVGTWKTTTSKSYLGGSILYSTAKTASATYTFTGRSVGLIVKRATNTGAFTVYVDGVKTSTVDSKASATSYRNIVWTKSWTSSAKHTIKIVVAGTAGRATVATDGIAYVK